MNELERLRNMEWVERLTIERVVSERDIARAALELAGAHIHWAHRTNHGEQEPDHTELTRALFGDQAFFDNCIYGACVAVRVALAASWNRPVPSSEPSASHNASSPGEAHS